MPTPAKIRATLCGVICLSIVSAGLHAQTQPTEIQTSVITLQNASADEAAQVASEVLSELRIGTDRRTNAVVASGRPADLERLTTLLRTLDTASPASPEMAPQILNVPASAPNDLMDLVKPMLSRQARASYNRASRLLVLNGPPGDVERVAQLLGSFSPGGRDAETGGGLQLAFYFLEGVLGVDTASVADPAPPPPPGESPNAPSPEDLATAQKLEKPLTISFERNSLREVLQALATHTGVVLIPQWNVLEGIGVGSDVPVALQFEQPVPTRIILQTVLDAAAESPGQLAYRIKDGIVSVTTRDELESNPFAQVYDVSDLVGTAPGYYGKRARALSAAPAIPPGAGYGRGGMGGGGFGGSMGMGMMGPGQGAQNPFEGGDDSAPTSLAEAVLEFFRDHNTAEEQADDLAELIRSNVTPDDWRDNGGFASITYFAGTLTITHTESAHKQIASLLDRLHAQTARSRAAISQQPLPPELATVAKALAEQGFHDPQLIAPIFVYTRSGERFRAEGIAPQPGEALQIEISGRAEQDVGPEAIRIDLEAGLREAPPLVGLQGMPKRPSLFELNSSVTTLLGDYVVLATAPGATGAGQAVAVVVRVTRMP